MKEQLDDETRAAMVDVLRPRAEAFIDAVELLVGSSHDK